MPYLLSARLEVSGARDFISDLDNAARAATNASLSIGRLKDIGVNFQAKGVAGFVSDMKRAEDAAQQAARVIEGLGTTETNLEAKGVGAFVGDMDRAADAARRTAQEINAAGQQTTGSFDNATASAGRFHGALDLIGHKAKTLGAYQAIILIELGIREAAQGILDFDKQITNALSIQPAAASFRGEMEQVSRSIAIDLGLPVGEVAEGFYFLASAGLDVEQQLAAIRPVANFAKAGLMDLGEATETATQAAAIFRGQNTLPEILDKITMASITSQGTIEQFSDALTNKAGTAAVTFGQSLDATLGVLAAFAERGINGRRAGEAYSIVLRDLAIKARLNGDAFEAMGIQVFDSQGNMNDINGIIGQMQAAFAGLNTEQTSASLSALGFTLRSQSVILTLLGMGSSAEQFTEKIKNAGGAAESVANNQMQSLQARLDQFKAIVVDFSITGFEKLTEAGNWLVTTLEPAIRALGPAAAAFAEGFGSVISTAGGLALGAIAGGIQAIAAGLEAVGNFAAQHTEAVRMFGEVVGAIAFAAAIVGVGGLVAALGAPLLGAIGGAAAAVGGFMQVTAGIALTDGILAAARNSWASLGDLIRNNPTAAVAGFIAAMALMAQEVKKEEKAAKDYAQAIADAYNTTTTDGMAAAAQHLQMQAPLLRESAKEARGLGDFLKTTADIIPYVDFKNTSQDLYGAARAAEELEAEMRKTATVSNEVVTALANWGNGVPTFGPMVGDLAAINEAIDGLGAKAGIASGQVQLTAEQLRNAAEFAGIDMKGPWEEWLPVLFETAVVHEGIARGLITLGVNAGDAAVLAGEMGSELDGVGDTAEDAAKQFDALTEAINGMIDGPLSAFAAVTEWEGALDDMIGKVNEFGFNLDAMTEGGREVRGALVDVVEALKDSATAMAEGDPAVYAAKLGEMRDRLIDTWTNLGLSAEAANALADELGLIPEVVDVAIAASATGVPEARTALDEAAVTRMAGIVGVADLDAAAAAIDTMTATPRIATVTAQADVAPADGALYGLYSAPRTAVIGTVVTQGDVADDYLSNFVARYRRTVIEAFSNAAQVSAELDAATYTRYVTIIARTIAVAGINAAVGNADGGVTHFYARGGVAESHVAQIAPAGSWRVWAEPETGGEAYIPLALSKRNRSMKIWEETGRRLGAMHYADGGIDRVYRSSTMPVPDAVEQAAVDITRVFRRVVPEVEQAATDVTRVFRRVAPTVEETVTKIDRVFRKAADTTQATVESTADRRVFRRSTPAAETPVVDAPRVDGANFDDGQASKLLDVVDQLNQAMRAAADAASAFAAAGRRAVDSFAGLGGSSAVDALTTGLKGSEQAAVDLTQSVADVAQEVESIPAEVPVAVQVETDLEHAQGHLAQFVDDPSYLLTVQGQADLALAQSDLEGLIAYPYETTVTTDANVAPADADLEGLISAPRTANIDTAADVVPADNRLYELFTTRRTATIGTEVAGGEAADDYLTNRVGRMRQAVINALSNAAQVAAELDDAARTRYMTIMVSTYNAANPGGPVGNAIADGAVMDFYAKGGMRENHVAQIAKAGSWRVWAEPETGGEAYIPLALAKRARSMRIWQETGRRLGAMQSYADGGINQSVTRMASFSTGSSGDVKVSVSPGAIQAHVSAQVGANPEHLAGLISDAMKPALDEFALDLATQIRRRG